MKLKELYKHRTDFTIIGLTGRTGSGCSQIAELLKGDFAHLQSGLRDSKELADPIFRRKYEICTKYLSYGANWQPYDVIQYKNVLLLYLLKQTGNKYFRIRNLLYSYYKEEKLEKNATVVEQKFSELLNVLRANKTLIGEIYDLPTFESIRSRPNLLKLHNIFFGQAFSTFSCQILDILEKDNYFRRTCLLHFISCNVRSSKKASVEENTNPDNVYTIAEIINTIIKSKKKFNDSSKIVTTKIVVDSLRNSLEISFFKERYSAFYMIATKDILNNSEKRLNDRFIDKIPDKLEREALIKKLIELDEVEYKNKDFSKGIFTSPNVENCIQKSDFHIFNLKKGEIDGFIQQFKEINFLTEDETKKFLNAFLTREEQLMKLISLISQPGLITPSASERNMQIAYTAKLNSGCISRQVGAVITDNKYVAKSVGWNDVAKGHTPCNLRSVDDFFSEDLQNNMHYSEFEKGKNSNFSDYKYKKIAPFNFKDAMVDYFKESHDKHKDDLNGKNCSFCFKSIHNHYEGESNQVHTRSLHAEENAMLQLTKTGGLGVEFGILFTTASPCELCSKKAYQLGIRLVYYIDPYPGIAVEQILSGGRIRPILIPFSGAIGSSYHKLYEPYLSAKDEIAMSLEMNDKNIHINQFKNILRRIYPKIDIDSVKSIADVETIIDQGLVVFEKNRLDQDY
jgi:deoxycytidylate deaminase